MVTEITILTIKEGMTSRFEDDFNKASLYISSIEGYITHQLKKCIEKEHQYILIVTWKTLEDHTIGFRQSEVYLKWKQLLHHYYEPFPEVEHYIDVQTN